MCKQRHIWGVERKPRKGLGGPEKEDIGNNPCLRGEQTHPQDPVTVDGPQEGRQPGQAGPDGPRTWRPLTALPGDSNSPWRTSDVLSSVNHDVLYGSGLLGGPNYAGLMAWPDTTQTSGPDTLG